MMAVDKLELESDRDMLASGLEEGGLTLYYLLTGRSSSAEMGQDDYVRLMCVNRDGQLVFRSNAKAFMAYKLHFVDQDGPSCEILF